MTHYVGNYQMEQGCEMPRDAKKKPELPPRKVPGMKMSEYQAKKFRDKEVPPKQREE